MIIHDHDDHNDGNGHNDYDARDDHEDPDDDYCHKKVVITWQYIYILTCSVRKAE